MRIIKWFLIGVSLHIFMMNTILANDNTLTWEKLGIGVHNKGEITDWTYFGIKTPTEASEWINALKPLGGVSYSGAARLWKQNGFTPQEVKNWILVGLKTPERVKNWIDAGVKDVREVQQWKDAGVINPWDVSEWTQSGVYSPEKVKEWVDASYSMSDVKKQMEKGYSSPYDIMREEKKSKKPDTITSNISMNNPVKITHDEKLEQVVLDNVYEPVTQNEDIIPTVNTEPSNGNGYQIFLLIYFIMMIITMFKGYGENRSVVIFRDYNDLGLTFLIPASFVLIYYLFMMLGGNPIWGAGLALVIAVSLFVILVKNTYEDNNKRMLATILSIMTKVPLGLIWILSFITLLNPSGKTAKERRNNRGTALVIMAILTPIIGMLVVEKEGSRFNPRDWVKGRRIGSVRNHL